MTPGALRQVLAHLPVEVESVRGEVGFHEVRPYEDERGRPTSLVIVEGASHQGRGEGVCWTLDAQRQLVDVVEARLLPGRGTVSDFASQFEGYARAAVEGALIDLALRQTGQTLASLTGVRRSSIRFVISFDACSDPADRAGLLLEANPGARFKVDVDSDWSVEQMRRLRELDCVEVLDFKLRGDAEQCRLLDEMFPEDVLFEDPPKPVNRASRDGVIGVAHDVETYTGDAINVKAPRMGGFLEVLAALEACRLGGNVAYFGGMFEVGPGRRQARQLAALFTSSSGNDLAPIPLNEADPRSPSPLSVRLDTPGFG